jgi:hypothetical protein
MLIPNWKKVARKAWSVHLMTAAAVLSGLEMTLPMFSDWVSRGTFAALTFSIVTLALLARFLVQWELHDD